MVGKYSEGGEPLLSGATPAWATMEHSIAGECPDIFNRLSFRMTIKKDKQRLQNISKQKLGD